MSCAISARIIESVGDPVRNVILISVDDLRFDALSCVSDLRYLKRHGIAGIRSTPNMDALAARGVRFADAFSTAPYTPAAHASMLTGLLPPRHQVRAFMTNPLPSGIPTLASLMAANGYRTVASLDVPDLFGVLGLANGFQDVIGSSDEEVWTTLASSSQPFFLFMHLEDVHPPVYESLRPPDETYNEDFYDELETLSRLLGVRSSASSDRSLDIDARRSAAVAQSGRIRQLLEQAHAVSSVELPRYLGGVNKFDSGRFASIMAKLEPHIERGAVMILTSDHGQGTIPGHRMATGRIPEKFDHGEAVMDEVLRVPLIVVGAGIEPGVREGVVSLVDIVPTIGELCDIPVENVDGTSLVPALEGSRPPESLAYAEVWYHDRAELSRFLKAAVAERAFSPDGYETFLHEQTVRRGALKLIATRRPGSNGSTTWSQDDAVTGVASSLGRDRLDIQTERLVNTEDDPWEEVNLLLQAKALRAGGLPERDLEPIAKVLRDQLDRLGSLPSEVPSEEELSESEADSIESHLRHLGYIE